MEERIVTFEGSVFDDDEAVFGLLEILTLEAELTPEERQRLQEIEEKITQGDVVVSKEDAEFIMSLAEKYNIVIV